MSTSLEARLTKKVPFVLRDVDPTADDYQGFTPPYLWLNRETDAIFLLTDVTSEVATWVQLIVSSPSQPAFLAIADNNQTDFAVDEYVTVAFPGPLFDQGNNFANNIFTAPVTGKYQLNATVYVLNVDADATEIFIVMETSNYQYYLSDWQPSKMFSADSIFMLTGSVLADMDANDTAYIRIYQIGGAAQGDIHYKSSFSGFLAC